MLAAKSTPKHPKIESNCSLRILLSPWAGLGLPLPLLLGMLDLHGLLLDLLPDRLHLAVVQQIVVLLLVSKLVALVWELVHDLDVAFDNSFPKRLLSVHQGHVVPLFGALAAFVLLDGFSDASFFLEMS